MNHPPDRGILYIVATPIGNLRDFTFRAVDVLQSVDLIAAEDTRHSKKLLQHYGISTPCMALHEHNEHQVSADIIAKLAAGQNIALISDAGTPLISDPGFPLVNQLRASNFRIVPIPGPNAAIAALSAAGIAADHFCFQGFLAAKSSARRHELELLSHEPRTLIFYETPHRLLATVADMAQIFGPHRRLVLARELTKLHETIYGDSLENMLPWLQADANRCKGEMVMLVEGAEVAADANRDSEDRVLALLLQELSIKKAATLAAQITGGKKNRLYQRALELKGQT